MKKLFLVLFLFFSIFTLDCDKICKLGIKKKVVGPTSKAEASWRSALLVGPRVQKTELSIN